MHSPATLVSVLAQTAGAALIVDETGTVLLASDQACRVLRYAPGELQGQSLELLIPERFRLAHIGHRLRFTDDRRTRPMGLGFEPFALCKDGSECRVNVSLKPVQRGLETLIVATIQARDSNFRMPSARTCEV
jgi:protein-histidine pros-kinase